MEAIFHLTIKLVNWGVHSSFIPATLQQNGSRQIVISHDKLRCFMCLYSLKFQPYYFSMDVWYPWQLGEAATFFLVFAALFLWTGVINILCLSSSLVLVTVKLSKRGSGSYTNLTKFLLGSSSPRKTHLCLRSFSASSQLNRPRFERCVFNWMNLKKLYTQFKRTERFCHLQS